MKTTTTTSLISVLLSIAAAICLLWLSAGCATAPLKGKIGNGKLDVDTGAVIKAAAAGASGDYAKALAEIGKAVEKREAKGDPLAGYAFTRTYFYDGTPVPDPSRITWVDKWERMASAGTATPPAVSTGTASGEPATAEDDALAGEIADILTDLGLARE